MGDWVDEHDIYDDGMDEDDEVCCHEDFDMDWDGYATCDHCGHRWSLTAEELSRMARAYDEYHEMCSADESKAIATGKD